MKRLLIPLMAVVVLAACARETPAPAPEMPEAREFILTAAAEGAPGTRTVIQDETMVYWQPGDVVKVFFDGTGAKFSTTATDPCPIAEFSGTLPILTGFNEGFSADKPLWGLYPWREDASADNEAVTTTLPDLQTGQAGSFAKDCYITLGRSNSFSMGFWGVCGGLRFSLTQHGIRQVTFESLNGEPLAGRIRVSFEGGVPAVQAVTEASSSITLKAPGDEGFQPGEWYYIVALPGTLERGFRLRFKMGSRVAELLSEKSATLKRSIFGTLPEVDRDLDFSIPGIGNPDDPIPFADEKIKAALVSAFDGNGDGELSFAEADGVTSLKDVFGTERDFISFDEFRFFNSVTEVPDRAFRNWTLLESITLPESLTRIGAHAFYNCSRLQALEIPESVRKIERYAFYNCASVPEFTLPARLDTLESWVFFGCEALREITIPEGVVRIGDCAFRKCTGLEEISLPTSLEQLGVNAFTGCSALKAFPFPEKLSAIENSAFLNCSALTEISLPEQLTAIGRSAFENCTGLTTLTIPSSVTAIGNGAFKGCTGLDEIRVLPAIPPAAESGMFDNTNNCPIYVPSETAYKYSEAPGWNNYLSRLRSTGGGSTFYTSTDYSQDGKVVLLQKASVGHGVNIILLGDGFVDRDMGDGGKYEQRMRAAMEQFFAYEPYTSQRERFNIYTVKVVSANAQYGYEQSNRRLTYEKDGSINFRSSLCTEYASKVPNTTGQPLKIAALCNSDKSVGRSYCVRTRSGWACCIVYDPGNNVLNHELGGHGFGDLWDEYTENSETFTDTAGLDQDWNNYAWGANTDWRNDPNTVRWAHFLADSRYAGEGLGIFEGAKLYPRGIYRPTNNSMMRHNNCPFNAPSREQIYKNIMKWSVGSSWKYDYETFVAADAAGRQQAAGRLKAPAQVAREQESLYREEHIPPVIIDDDVKEVAFPISGPPVPRFIRR